MPNRLSVADVQRIEVHAAGYFGFEDGLITRIEEYAGLPAGVDA